MQPDRIALIKATLNRRQPDLTLLAEDTQKTHNVAALLRTCDAVGIFRMHAVNEDGVFPRHRMIEAGVRRWVKTRAHRSLDVAVTELRSAGMQLVAAHLSADAIDYREFDYTRPTALVVGSERPGLSSEAAGLVDSFVKIPMHGMVESLNVSVASALILYEAARQREAAGMYQRSRLAPDDYRNTLFEWCQPDIARRCRDRGLPYPAIDADGDLAENPFDDAYLAGGT